MHTYRVPWKSFPSFKRLYSYVTLCAVCVLLVRESVREIECFLLLSIKSFPSPHRQLLEQLFLVEKPEERRGTTLPHQNSLKEPLLLTSELSTNDTSLRKSYLHTAGVGEKGEKWNV